MLLSKNQKKALVEALWTGVYDKTLLPYWLFDLLATNFEKAAVGGWGNALGKGLVEDLELERLMQENIYYFAARKTAHELNDMHNVLLISKGKEDFVKRALEINNKYNKNWYETEYRVTQRIAKAGREWRSIEETAEAFPLLRFIAVMDTNTRDAHAALNGVVRPIGDGFWKTYFPPLDWNCRCTTERVEGGEKKTPIKDIAKPPVIDQFRERVTDSKKIWHESHPYFSGLSDEQIQASDLLVVEKLFNNTNKL